MKFVIGAATLLVCTGGALFWVFYEPDSKVALGSLPEQGSKFGSDRVKEGEGAAKPVPFDGKRAMKYLQTVCDLGPRISGSKAMRKQQEIIKKHFEELGAKVTFQTFEAEQNSIRGK